MTLYIPSKGRSHFLSRTVPGWLATGLRPTIVLPSDDVEAYSEALHVLGTAHLVDLHVQPDSDNGIGWARQRCLELAAERGQRAHIQCDDDQIVDSNLAVLLDACGPRVPAVGAWLRIYHQFLGDPEGRSVVLSWNGCGEAAKALNTDLALEVGGFDTTIHTYEDNELILRIAVKTGCLPKRVHTGTTMKTFNARGDKGGCRAAYQKITGGADAVVQATHDRLNERYGPGTAKIVVPKNLVPDGRTMEVRINWHGFWKSLGVVKEDYELLT